MNLLRRLLRRPRTPETPEPRITQLGRANESEPTPAEEQLIAVLDGLSRERFEVVIHTLLDRKAFHLDLVEQGIEPPPQPIDEL